MTPARHDAWFTSALAPFRTGVFAAIWGASLASNIGTMLQTVGAAWLMMSLAHSSDMVALVQAASAAPIMLLSIAAGVLADIWDRRALMLLALGLMGTTGAALTALAYAHAIGPWALLAFTFLLGCGSALYGPAWQSSVGEQVPPAQLPAAVALNSISFNIARTVGPAIGGVIVASAGPPAAFLVNVLSYAGLIAVLVRWRRPRPVRTLPPESIGGALGAGVRYARLSPAIRNVLVRGALFGFFSSGLWATTPLIARDLLGGGPLTYGLLLGAFGIGGVLAALGSTWLRRHYSTDAIATTASVAFGVATVAIAGSRWLAPTALAMLCAGGAWVLSFSTFNITVQTSSPRWVVGRMLALYQTTAFGGIALGSWLWGEVAEYAGLPSTLITSGLVLAATFIVTRRVPLHPTETVNLDPLRGHAHDASTTHVDPEAGPIVISIEYRIAPEDADGFLRAAHALGRIRRRDGARRWHVLQDLDDPGRWLERYETVTWLDHLRQRHRTTVADREVRERLLALHRGPAPPRVRHLLARAPGDGHEPEAGGGPNGADPRAAGR